MNRFKLVLLLLGSIFASMLNAQMWESFDQASGLPANMVQAVCVDADGQKWFGTTQGLAQFDGSDWTTYQKNDSIQTLASNNIRDIAFEITTHGPEIWLATDNGVSVMGIGVDGISMATPYRADNTGLVSNAVHAVGVDSSHQRWFGTEGGVSMFDGSAWQSWTKSILSNNDVRAIGIDNIDGWRYLCTIGGGVSRLRVAVDGITSASPYNYAWSALMSDTVTAVCVEQDGDQWFGTPQGPAFHDTTETKTNWKVWDKANGLVDNRIQAIAQDFDGSIWYGTPTGASFWDGQSFTNYTEAEGLIDADVRDIAIDHDGSIWFATAGGVSHFMPKTRVEYDPQNLAASFSLLPNYPNPFNPSTTLQFQLDRDAFVALDIYNLIGQHIRSLIQEERSAGSHFVPWDGLTKTRQSANSGVYLVRFVAKGIGWTETGSQKIVMMK